MFLSYIIHNIQKIIFLQHYLLYINVNLKIQSIFGLYSIYSWSTVWPIVYCSIFYIFIQFVFFIAMRVKIQTCIVNKQCAVDRTNKMWKEYITILTMENDRLAIVYVANEDKELSLAITYGQTIEDLCLKVKKILKK